MSSGFVAAGADKTSDENEDGWLEARKVVEASRASGQEEGRQEGGKSLFEVLQQNKTAKQEAFEESLRLKNQFRTLDEDEVDFLDNIMESTRAREQQLKRETAEELDTFRRKRQAAEKAVVDANVLAGNPAADPRTSAGEESWVASSRKRRRAGGNEDGAVLKLRRKSSGVTGDPGDRSHERLDVLKAPPGASVTNETTCEESEGVPDGQTPEQKPLRLPKNSAPHSSTCTSILGLGAYGSDEE